MGLCLEAACKRKFWSGHLGNNPRPQPSTINVIEPVAYVPSLLHAHPLIDIRVVTFRRSINNSGPGFARQRSFYFLVARVGAVTVTK